MKNKILRLLLFGFLLWLIPFVAAFGFYDSSGNLTTSYDLFKSSMIVISSLTGCFLMYKYFQRIENNFSQEGVIVGIIWLAMNLLLDLFILVPFAKMNIGDYFVSIGLRYLQIPVISFMAGKLLQART